jgi:hypothetical protein
MRPNNNILIELVAISPLLAGNGKLQTPYQVPVNYFDQLTSDITACISTEPTVTAGKENPYQAPVGYFNSLASTILNRIKAEASDGIEANEELKTIAPSLASLSKQLPFSKPKEYFEELSENVVAGIQAIDFVKEELENTSPLLNAVKKKNVYSVPSEYFNAFPNSVLSKINQTSGGLVVTISFQRKLFRLAAAVIVGVVVTCAWFFTHSNIQQPNTAKNIPTVVNDWMSDSLSLLNEEELTSMQETALDLTDEMADFDNSDVAVNEENDLLTDIPDEMLEQYLYEGVSSSVNNN